MAAIRIYRQLQELKDVDPNGLPDQGVPQYETSVSSFVVQTIAAGGGGSFSLGASNLGNTLGDTGVTGTRVVLAGVGNLTLSQATDANGGTISISGGTAGAGFSAGVSGGNTAGSTGITGTRLVLAGGNNVTLSQSTDANGGTVTVVGPVTVAQSVQTQGLFDLTLDGNTAGALALVSSGTLTLAGGNSITLSQNGNAITISGATTSQSVQTQAIQTGISSIVASNATYTSGSVQFTGSGIITIRSSANQRVVVDASQSVQTQNLVDVTISGNTAGAGALVSSGTLTLAGGNNITLSQAGNAITISGPAAGGAQTAISGLANSQTTYTSGTVSLSELGAITIRSTTGNQFQFSVNSQSVQPETQTFVGGIAASNTTYTSGTVTITGVGGGITVSSNTGQRIDLSVAAQSAESQSIGMSNIGNTSGTTGIASGAQVRMLFAGGNSITLSQSLNGASGTITISGPSISESIGMSNLGNTSGTTGIASGPQVRFLFAGGNNITLSQSLNGASGTLTISGPNAQTGLSGLANSQTTYTSGTVSLSELGAITIRSTTGNQFQLSVNAQTGTQFSAGISGGNTSGDTGTVAGRLVLAGGNNITLSGSTNGVSETITISAGAGGGFSGGVSNIGNTSGDTGITGSRLVLSGGQSVTLSQSTNASGATVMISGASTSQSVQSLGMYAVQNTTGQSSSTTMDARTLSIAGDGAVSVGYSGGSLRISAPVQTAESQSIGMSNLGNTSGTTGIASGAQVRMLFAGGNNVTLSQSLNGASGTLTISAANQTVQTQNVVDVTLSGNTSGALALISSGTMTLAGGNNITISQAGNAITISGANVGGAQTGISGIIASDATYTSGTVQFTGSNIVTIRSSAGQRVVVDATDTDRTSINQVAHGFAVGDWVRLSGTSYTKAQADSETNAEVVGVVSAVADADNFTLTTGGLVTGLSGLTAGAVYYLDPSTAGAITSTEPTTSGQISKPVFIARTTTSGYVFNMRGNIVPAGSMTAFLAGVSNVGNSSGNTGITGSQLVLAGGNNITLSQSTNASGGTVTISAFTQSVQPGIQNLVASDTTFSSGTVSISGFGDITVNTAANLIRISGPVQTVESQSFGMSNIGNTSGTTGIASGGQVRFLLAGGNNVTLSQSINGASGTITISAFNQSAQTGLSGLANSQTTYTSGTVSMSELGAITIRSTTGNQFQFSVAAQTAESQSIGMSNLGNTSGTTGIASGAQVRMLFAGGNNITLSQSLNGASGTITISAPNQSAQTAISGIANSQTTYTSGTVSMSELGAITIRSTTGNQYQFSVNAQTGTQFSAGISGGNTSGDTGTVAGRVVLAGGNNVTLSGSTNGVSETITISAFNQTGTQFSAGLSNIGNTAGDTVTVGGRLILAGGNGITLSGSSNGASQTITISGVTQSVESQSIGMSNIGNTAGTTGIASGGQVRFLFAGGNNITLSQSLNGASGTITISAPNLGAGAMSVGVSNLGNTAGSTGITGTRLVLVGSNAISLSQSTDANGGTITFNDTVSAFQAGVSTGGNTAGDTGVTGTRLVLVGSSPISLSQATGANGGTVSINAPATSSLVGVSGISVSTNGSTISIMQTTGSSLATSFAPYDDSPMVTGQQGNGTLHIQPIRVPDLQMDRIVIAMQVSNATNSSGSFTLSQWAGIYTRNVSTISLVSSTSVSTNFTMSGTAGSYSRIGGPRALTIPWTMTLTDNDYYVGLVSRTTSGGADVSVSALLLSKFTNVDWSGILGTASNASDQRLLGLGIRSATTSGIPASIAFTDLRGTGSIVLRSPVFQLRSGTV